MEKFGAGKRGIWVVIGSLVALVGAGGVYFASRKSGNDSVSIGKVEAPAFQLRDSTGKVHSLAELKGQPVVVHFWASWCPPCVDELPNWLEAARLNESLPVRWVAISLDETWEEAHKILPKEKLPPNVISLLDSEKKTPEAYGSFQFPESYLLNRDHRIVRKWVASQDWQGAGMKSALTEVSADAQ